MNRLFIDNTIGDLIKKLQSNELSPDDLIRASLENIKETDAQYLAWEVYLEDAKKKSSSTNPMDYGTIDSERLLGHIPIGVKDIYNTCDFPTQMGSSLWKGFTPGNDARAVYNLKRQGAVVVGKTVTAEFAVHALEKTKNPWGVTRTPGTSSSGSAVAITLGQVPFATGTQTAGSIVRPASFCGIYGMKPSFGLIPRTGMLKTTDSLDTLGFFTIHESDLRRGFDSMRISGKDYPISNTALSDSKRQKKSPDRPWRIGFVRTHTWEFAPDYAKKSIEEFIKKLSREKGFEVIDASLPEGMRQTHVVHETIYNKALSYYFQNEYKQTAYVSPVMNDLIKKGNAIPLDTYTQALEDQMTLIYEMDDFFSDFDILISLSTSGEAPLREITEFPDSALMWTLTHLPVVSVPQFFSPNGFPFGMQVVARKYNDYLLLNFLEDLRLRELIPERAGYAITHKTA
jgi:Asp-tRNA(Asn)/Glu-tRNA(Gln) amidotransferase A subunit family amidase